MTPIKNSELHTYYKNICNTRQVSFVEFKKNFYKTAPDLWYVYIVETFDHQYYIGVSNNVDKRIENHNNGKGAKCLKSQYKRPVKLVYQEKCENRSSALKREHQLKKLSHDEKKKLVES